MPGPRSRTVSRPVAQLDGDDAVRRAPLDRVVEQVGHRALAAAAARRSPARARRRRRRPCRPGARRRTRAAAGSTTSARSSGSGSRCIGSSRASSTRSPTSVLSSSICARTSAKHLGAGVGRQPAAAVGLREQLEVGAQAGERRAQLVPGVGDQLGAGAAATPPATASICVEGRAQPGQLVVAGDGDRRSSSSVRATRSAAAVAAAPAAGRWSPRPSPANPASTTPAMPDHPGDQRELVEGLRRSAPSTAPAPAPRPG